MSLVIILGLALLLVLTFLGYFGSETLIHPRRTPLSARPTDYHLPYEDVSFTTDDGIILHGWFVPAQHTRGTIVFCHGWSGNKEPDLKYVPWLWENGYSVLLFDFRNHGDSGGSATSMCYLERKDLLAALEYLRGRGVTQVGVMGFSMGAAVAIATAPLSPIIHAVIADSGFAELHCAIANGLRLRYSTLGPFAQPLARFIVFVAGWRIGLDLSQADPIHWVGRISPRPLFIIHGGRDPYVHSTEAQRLYAAAGEPKSIWLVTDAGHREADISYPQEYKESVLAFFDQWLTRRKEDLP
ncbi:MAG: alpha/beta hydrolase [Chloroflexi bacterium]|nr:alpha/beta hydrolase [Chloroflexota bacterium]